jgi:hypothetical protein
MRDSHYEANRSIAKHAAVEDARRAAMRRIRLDRQLAAALPVGQSVHVTRANGRRFDGVIIGRTFENGATTYDVLKVGDTDELDAYALPAAEVSVAD